MPRAYLMSWEGYPYFRWVKMVKKTRYRVGCHELPITRDQWTKEGSGKAADEWWVRKAAELSAAKLAVESADYPALPGLQKQLDFAKRHGLTDEAEVIEGEILDVKSALPGEHTGQSDATSAKLKVIKKATGANLSNLDPYTAELLVGDGDVWNDRYKREKAADPDKSIGALAAKWVADRQDESIRGLRSATNADVHRLALDKFAAFVGPSNGPDDITAELWQRWFNYCQEMVTRRDRAGGRRVKRDDGTLDSWSIDTAKKVFSNTRAFVRDLWTVEKLSALPRNLDDPKHKFKAEDDDEPAVFKTAEVHALLTAAKGVHRLILLLGMNCGMYGVDISDLRKDQIDFERGRIARRRSKTRTQKGSLKVSYKLWPETLELLKTHVNTDPNEVRALLTKGNRPWVWSRTVGDGERKKIRKSDTVATIFNNIKAKIGMDGPDKSFKTFRKSSATRLENNPKYSRLEELFLSHKSRTVAGRNYVEVHRKALDRAILWLRRSYRLEELGLIGGTA